MFGYNWLVHNLRVATVEMDNFAQEFSAKIESEYLQEVPVNSREPHAAPKEKIEPAPMQREKPLAEPELKSEPIEETRVDLGKRQSDQPDLLPPDAEANV